MSEISSILIVDDDPITRVMAGSALADAQYRVQEAQNGEEAIECIQSCRPDIFLVDVQMPIMNGLDFCRWLRARTAFQSLPVLIMTTLNDNSTIEKAFEAGASDFIAKPFNFNILSYKIRFLLRAYQDFRALEVNRRLLSDAQVVARMGSWEIDLKNNTIHWSEQLYHLLQRPIDHPPRQLDDFLCHIHPDDYAEVQRTLHQAHLQQEAYELVYRLLLPNEKVTWIHQRTMVDYDENGQTTCLHGTLQDITEQLNIQERLRYLKQYDAATGLANREQFVTYLEQIIPQAQAANNALAVMHIELNNYHRVSDGLGHHAGNDIIRALSVEITNSIQHYTPSGLCIDLDDIFIARWGSNDLVLLLKNLTQSDVAIDIGHLLVEMLQHPFSYQDLNVTLHGHLGIAIYPDDGEDADALCRAASAAAHEAGQQATNPLNLSSPSKNQSFLQRLSLESDLRNALTQKNNQELVLYYQPKFDHNHQLHGAEALIRWQHPVHGLLSPDIFIPIAEESRLILQLGEWVIEHACQELSHWHIATSQPFKLAINLSAPHFIDEALLPTLDRAVQRHQVLPQNIELELTESTMMQNSSRVQKMLKQLNQRGFSLAIDDFGTGHSSLHQLGFLPLNTLKIDRSFVQSMEESPKIYAIVSGIIALAKQIQMEVVAEGVETEIQAAMLKAKGCNLIQGYLFSKPIPASDFRTILKQSR